MENNLPPLPETDNSSSLKFVFVGMGVLVFGVALVLTAVFWDDLLNFRDDTEEATLVTLDGTLIMSVGVIEEDNVTGRVLPSTFDFDVGEPMYVPVDRLRTSSGGESIAYQHSFSNNGNFVTFLGAVLEIGQSSTATPLSSVPFQVYRAEVGSVNSGTELIKHIQEAEPLTIGENVFRYAPTVSDQGDVL